MAGLDLIGPLQERGDNFLRPVSPPPPPPSPMMSQGGGSGVTSYQYPADEGALLRQAYAEQEANYPFSMQPPSAPGNVSVSLQPPSDGLRLASSTGGGGMSSVGGDFNWLMALGGAMQAGGAAHFGNFGVPQQYFQLKQQRDQMVAQAEERKQVFAMQQAKLAEEQKQHAFQQVTSVLTNKDASESQKATLLEELAKGNNPQIAQFARTAMDGIGKKRLSRIGLYMDRYPGQMQKLAEGMLKGSVSSDDIDARLGLIDEIEKHNAKISGEMELENEIKSNPDAPPGAKSWLAEREAKRMKEQAEANVKNQTQQAEVENANLKPELTRSQIAKNQHEGGDWTKRSTSLAMGMYGVSPGQITADQVNSADDVRRAAQMGFTIQEGVPRFSTLAKMGEVEVPERIAEAGARAREQVKVETSLAPGVMMLDNLTKLTEKPGMFLSEKDGTWNRIKQMGASRLESAKGTDDYRLWNQMADGMRATLARMAMEVGNLAATEQDRALHLIADPYGGLHGLPDSREVARKKHALLGEFLKAGLEGPQGPDGQSRVQERLKGILDRLDTEAPLPPITGDVTPQEGQLIKAMIAEGKSRRSIQAEILKRRGGQ